MVWVKCILVSPIPFPPESNLPTLSTRSLPSLGAIQPFLCLLPYPCFMYLPQWTSKKLPVFIQRLQPSPGASGPSMPQSAAVCSSRTEVLPVPALSMIGPLNPNSVWRYSRSLVEVFQNAFLIRDQSGMLNNIFPSQTPWPEDISRDENPVGN